MRHTILMLLFAFLLLSCEEENNGPNEAPSTIEFELQTFGDLSGGIFGEKHTLVRKTREYQADNENGTYSSESIHPEDLEGIIDIVGWGNDLHPHVKQIYIRIPNKGVGTYSFDPETSDEKHFWLKLETTYQAELQAGYSGWGSPKTEITVVISEITEDRIKGSFTADLIYYNVEILEGGAKRLTIEEEISYVNKPIINGTFDVFKSTL